MRILSPNYDREDGLETVLEVPMPEEMFGSGRKSVKSRSTKPAANGLTALFGCRNAEIQMLLGVTGAPLIPFSAVSDDNPISKVFKNQPIEAAMAKYIVKQYQASVGGERALNLITSMYAMGKVQMGVTESCAGEESLKKRKKMLRVKNVSNDGDMGGFVLWQKGIDLWSLELVVSDFKLSAGCDGKLAWSQTSSHTHRGPPRPLRRFLQGLDPKSTAALFANSICIGEKKIDNEDCFVLKVDAEAASRTRTRSNGNVEIIRHTIWGCFSQRTGLLIQLEDTQLLRTTTSDKNSIFWETTMETQIQDYRTVDGVQIAHKGNTNASLFRFGEQSENHSRTRMKESWEIEEVGFNVEGLSTDCFLPPSDLNIIEEEQQEEFLPFESHTRELSPCNLKCGSLRFKSSKVNAIDFNDQESIGKKHIYFI